ncbi:hypothetical protein M3Y96_00096700 [Aphelenchoides besseyi]|nr:hypothetical protein M3Y96_00096700 [Aphelenchoides besseyi]
MTASNTIVPPLSDAPQNSWLATFSIPLILIITTLVLVIVVVPIVVYFYDQITSKKQVPLNAIVFDPKGFSTNDLYMLNARQMKTGCKLREVNLNDQGGLNVPNSQMIMLPNAITQEGQKPLIADQLFADTLKDSGTTGAPLKFLQIYEWKDLTNLAPISEGEQDLSKVERTSKLDTQSIIPKSQH